MGEKLKPCPFCGGESMISSKHNFVPALLCGDCGAMMIILMSFQGDAKEELQKKWNRRANETPCKIGDTMWEIRIYSNSLDECRVSSLTQKADGSWKIRLTHIVHKWSFEVTPDDIGKKVFFSKEEAEKVLARKVGDSDET